MPEVPRLETWEGEETIEVAEGEPIVLACPVETEHLGGETAHPS